MKRLFSALAILSTFVPAGGARAAPPPAFQIVDLGNLGAGTGGQAYSVNVFGEVVGASCGVEPDTCHAFLWTRATGMVDLGANATALAVTPFHVVLGTVTLPGGAVRPFTWTRRTGFRPIDVSLGGDRTSMVDANDWGQIVGDATLSDPSVSHAFAWTPFHGIVDLGTLGGSRSVAASVSNLGHVVGWSTLADGVTERGFFWTRRTGMVDVGTLGGGSSAAHDVNSRGVVVGGAATPGGRTHAFSWSLDGGMVDLGTLGGDDGESRATIVNERGQIVGDASGTAGTFFWSAETGMIDLGSLGGGATNAVAMNDAGQVVGISRQVDAIKPHAFSWTLADGMVDLGTLPGGDVSIALAVSQTGVVAGYSFTASGEMRPVLWVPTRR